MTTTNRICAFLQSKLPHSFWTFHGDSIRAFVEKEVSLNSPVSPSSETVGFSETPSEDPWRQAGDIPDGPGTVALDIGGDILYGWYGHASRQWYGGLGMRDVVKPIRWRELTDAERESIHG